MWLNKLPLIKSIWAGILHTLRSHLWVGSKCLFLILDRKTDAPDIINIVKYKKKPFEPGNRSRTKNVSGLNYILYEVFGPGSCIN